MSDRAAVLIKIGGTIRRCDVRTLAETAEADDAGENYEGHMPAHDLEDMIEGAHATGQIVEFSNNEKAGASFELLEEHCRALGLPYARFSDAYVGSWPEGISFWEPGMAEPREFASYGYIPAVTAAEIRAAQIHLPHGRQTGGGGGASFDYPGGDECHCGQPYGLDALLDMMDRIEGFAERNKIVIADEAEPAPAAELVQA